MKANHYWQPGAVAAATLCCALAGASETTAIGKVDFQVSCAPEVRADFDRAVAYLHHMTYTRAQLGFEAVAAKDPRCAMAHWGIASTLFQPLWPSRPSAADLQRGWQAVQQAKSIGGMSAREQALLAAVEAFFREPDTADWWTRIGRWAEAMEQARRAHPEDREIAAFYALSRLAAGQVAADRRPYNEDAAQVLLAIYKEEPTHPGAIHYTIHANDIEGRQGETPEIMKAYGDIAPSVPHALHMPTHIFVRLGDWQETIAWNRRSADAALQLPTGGLLSHQYVHAVDYQLYAHLQRGEDAEARALLEDALRRGEFQPAFISAFHLATMPARLAVERRDWKAAATIEPRQPASLPWDEYFWPEGISWFARGLGAAHTGRLDEARAAKARMAALRDRARQAGEKDFATYIEVDRLILAGRIAQATGQPDEAVARMREAAALEDTVEKHPVTPGSLLPPNEALGDLLMELRRPAEALAAYRASLAIWPGRYQSLLGAARAAKAAGELKAARDYYAQLVKNAGPASRRDSLAEAKQAAVGRT